MLEYLARFSSSLRRAVPFRIAIMDDLFPHPVSGFRLEEFCCYLDEVPGVSIYTNGGALPLVSETRPVEAIIAEHVAGHPLHGGRIHPLQPDDFPQADAYYAIFLNNIVQYVEAIERTGKPFAFTLYPGGGFGAGDALSDGKLHRVFGSPSFHSVIVTQPFTRDYLLKIDALTPSRIRYLPGGMVPLSAFAAPRRRRRFGINKASLDIGFVANRYTAIGEDKGYDLFVEVAKVLDREGVNAAYHVVGPWDAGIIPLGELSRRFVFHGFVRTERLRQIGQMLDLILSPNRVGILAAGAFDGFPTGSCVEVGLQETAIFCTDVLKLNMDFRDGIDLVLVEPNVDHIVPQLLRLIQQPTLLARIGKSGRTRLIQVFSRERQLPPRLAVLRSLERR